MRCFKTMAGVAALLTTFLALGPVDAGAVEDGGSPRHGGWEFSAIPYFWLPETHGTARLGDSSVDFEIGLDDVFDSLGDGNLFGGMGRFEARKGKLALFVDSLGAVINEAAAGQTVSGGAEVNVDLDYDIAVVEFGAAYRVLERGRFTLEGIAGGRYTYTHMGIKVKAADNASSDDQTTDFVDPFFGGRGTIRLAEQWSLVCRGDVGGFGAGSELAWTVLGGVLWNTPWKVGAAQVSLFAGYKVYDLDYETGRGDSEKGLELQMRGSAFGTLFTF